MAMDAKKLKGFAERDAEGKKSKPKFGKRPAEDEEDTDEEEEKKGNPFGGGEDKDDEGDTDEDGGGEGGDDSDEEIAAKVAARVASGTKDDDVMANLEGYDPEVDGNPPEWVDDEETWARAKKAVETNWDSYDEPWAVVAHVYKEMGGGFV